MQIDHYWTERPDLKLKAFLSLKYILGQWIHNPPDYIGWEEIYENQRIPYYL